MSRIALRWHAALSLPQDELAKTLISDCVDLTLAALLTAIDAGDLKLSYTASNGLVVDLSADGLGELCGSYLGGWNLVHTKERAVDDFADLS